jgi:hypothetical protein
LQVQPDTLTQIIKLAIYESRNHFPLTIRGTISHVRARIDISERFALLIDGIYVGDESIRTSGRETAKDTLVNVATPLNSTAHGTVHSVAYTLGAGTVCLSPWRRPTVLRGRGCGCRVTLLTVSFTALRGCPHRQSSSRAPTVISIVIRAAGLHGASM